jgi:hypothetical protein
MADSALTTSKNLPHDRTRPAVIMAALLYLVAAYQRTPCPYVALCIVRHLECLASHEGTDPVIRQICRAVRETWAFAATQPRSESTQDASSQLLH